MSTRSVVFRMIGCAGAVAVAAGIHGIIRAADCTAEITTCTPGAGQTIGLLAGGFVTGVAGMIGGGGLIVFAALFAGVGVGGVTAGLASTGFGHGFGLLFGGIFLVAALIPTTLVALARIGGRRTRQLLATGSRGIATVLDLQDTGVTINDNPRVRLRLLVQPADGTPPFEVTIARTVSRVDVPRRGDQAGVVFDPADRSTVEWDPNGVPPIAAVLPPPGGVSTAPTAPAFGTPSAPAPAGPALGVLSELERLESLRAAKALTDDEFARLKSRLLAE
ncbi:MAG TPA: SHOCT domain-containing protein [Kineosporiaceae bacterium]